MKDTIIPSLPPPRPMHEDASVEANGNNDYDVKEAHGVDIVARGEVISTEDDDNNKHAIVCDLDGQHKTNDIKMNDEADETEISLEVEGNNNDDAKEAYGVGQSMVALGEAISTEDDDNNKRAIGSDPDDQQKTNDVKMDNEADETETISIPTKKRIGRPPGQRPLKRANLKPKVDDPGKDMSNLRCSNEFIRYLKKKKRHDLSAAYSELQEAKEERDLAEQYVKDKKEEVEKIRAKLQLVEEELEEGESHLEKEEECFQGALNVITELELQRPGSWNEHYHKLVAYKEEHGHINLPTRHRDDKEFDHLCVWVNRQKSQYKQYQYGETKNERPWRITALEKLGIEWEVRSGLWDKHYKELVAYKSQHGNCMVPTRTSKEYKDLGLWVTVQREEGRKHMEGKKGTINQERIDLLNKIGFVWNVTKFQWQEMYEKLLTFSSEEGHANVPPVYPHDQPLSNWVSRQRKEYRDYHDKNVDHERDSLGRLRSMRMTEERIELLNNIGFEW